MQISLFVDVYPLDLKNSLSPRVVGLSFYTKLRRGYLKRSLTQIVSDRVSERSKGFGFVTFASEDEAHKALEKMNGKPLNGRVIFVDYAKPRTNYGSGMPIARGPPDSIKDGLSTYARSSIRWGALAGRIKCGENQIHFVNLCMDHYCNPFSTDELQTMVRIASFCLPPYLFSYYISNCIDSCYIIIEM
ncbi:hypothetical protein TB2_014398 [Malus domestica]